MATLKTYSKGANLDLRKLAPPSMANAADMLRTELAPVTDELTGGCAAGATLTGPTRAFTGGSQRVIAAGWASAPGVLYVETSSDGGATWPNQDFEPIPAGEYVTGCATTLGGANRYRLRFVCGPVGASRVTFSSQARA
jgi:hypothetical protein